jgi:hypothetical protein
VAEAPHVASRPDSGGTDALEPSALHALFAALAWQLVPVQFSRPIKNCTDDPPHPVTRKKLIDFRERPV